MIKHKQFKKSEKKQNSANPRGVISRFNYCRLKFHYPDLP